ncbi:hypothetical protein WN55_06249 [Dufourea novaeangliae]|uniref:MADF domain-containing protein n=1 Tax=Dufourea novaeangliae TaxID=178035 RepID=A0A154PRG5_DUFNO|nr:hypothetical protein WN55_06249 [Dufourea novaeangliae]
MAGTKNGKDVTALGALGTPGAGAGAVVERAAPVSSSDDREDWLVDHQATGFLSTTGGEEGRKNKNKMDTTRKECNVTAPGEFGAPGAGAGVVVKQATPASLSDDCGARLVDHQACGALTATGEGRGSNTPSEAVPGPSGPARPLTGGAPMVRLRRLPDGLVRCSSSRSIDRVVPISDDEDGDSDASAVSASSVRSGVVGPGDVSGRKRGRPPAAGERFGLAEAKRKLIKLTLKERGLREEDIEDRAVPPLPVHKSCMKLPPADVVAEEMRRAPTPDLGAVINDRIQALNRVSDAVRETKPGVTIEECVTKFHSLRTQYNTERAKVEKSKKSGAGTDDIYKPSLWYYHLRTFLDVYFVPRKSKNSLEKSNTNGGDLQGSTYTGKHNFSQNNCFNVVVNEEIDDCSDTTILCQPLTVEIPMEQLESSPTASALPCSSAAPGSSTDYVESTARSPAKRKSRKRKTIYMQRLSIHWQHR